MLDALKTCTKNSAPGEDRISYEILKQIPRSCQTVILKFYNHVWKKGHLPPDWKVSMIRPMLKPDKSPFNVTSYRPVALTSTLCKLMEKMVSTRLRWWLEDKQLFNKCQSGFRKNRSTIDQILRLADDAHKAIHNKQYTLAVMIDLEKAFDLVWHKGLVHKMKMMGLKDNILNFVSDFLNDRSIKVRIGSSLSTSYKLENGTPQGSVISPFLFLIMINDIDMPENNTKLSLYADDSATWKTESNLEVLKQDIQKYLDKIIKFFNDWGFKISVDKTVAILFTKRRNIQLDEVKLYVNGKAINVQTTVKFLGVIFDHHMSWKPHIDYVADRCNKRLNLMRVMAGTRWGAGKSVLLTVYKALIRSVMDYACIAYDTASVSVKSKLDSIQYKAMRICCGAMTGTSATSLQCECGQPPLHLRRQRMLTDFSLKIKSVPDHPAATTLEDCWQNHYGKFKKGREPYRVKVKKILRSADIEDVPLLPKDTEPWEQTTTTQHHLQQQKERIRQVILDKWQETYDYDDSGNFYNELHPIVNYKIREQLLPRRKDVQITRLRLGHVQLNQNLHKIGQVDSPNCSICDTDEDIHHFIFQCPKQKELQRQLKQTCTDYRKAYNMRTILKTKECVDVLYEYLRIRNIFL